jgi:hypothetical protein
MSSNFSTDGTYLGENGNAYKMYDLTCSLEAKESVLERLERLPSEVIAIVAYTFADGTVGIDYCKALEQPN